MSSPENELPCCPTCWQTFDSQKALPIVFSCGHCICVTCNENPKNTMKKCPICMKQISSRMKNSGLIETLKTLETMCEQIEEPCNSKNNIQCSNCQKWVLEKNMFFCKKCIVPLLNSENENVSQIEKIRRIMGASMCSNCIVPMHSYKGHKILSAFPVWRKHNFLVQSSKLESKLKLVYDGFELIDQALSDFKAVSNQIIEDYYKLADLEQNCVTIERKNEIFGKMIEFMDEAISIPLKAEQGLRLPVEMYPEREGSLSALYSKNITLLEKFEKACQLLDQTISKAKAYLIKHLKNYGIWIDQNRRCETIEIQNERLGVLEKNIDIKTRLRDGVQFVLIQYKTHLKVCHNELNGWYNIYTRGVVGFLRIIIDDSEGV